MSDAADLEMAAVEAVRAPAAPPGILTAHVDTFARDNLPPRELWPDLLFDLPELRYPERLNYATELLDRGVERGFGPRIAIRSAAATWTYDELLEKTNRIANVLVDDLGLVPGNRVLLRAPNTAMLVAAWLAVQKAGGVIVPTMSLLRARELTEVVQRARISHALCDAGLADELEQARAACPTLVQVCHFSGGGGAGSLEARMARQPATFDDVQTAADDVAMIAFTSGTTGKPKGAMHFHRDFMSICNCFPRSMVKTEADDVFCGTPSLAFTYGMGGLMLFPLHVGASTVLVEKPTAEALMQSIEDCRGSVVFTGPTLYRQMAGIAARYDVSSIRRCVSAGEALPDATRQLWKQATGVEIIDGIGATEMSYIFIAAADGDIRRGATGKPVPGYQACVIDEDGRPVPPGTVGRLAVKGPTGCRYLADERQRVYVQNGWNVTGDAYLMDEDGYFFYQARADDMIISAGYNIAGPEVEAALLEHPAVAECGVIGAPDGERGQIVKAFVVLEKGYRGDEATVATLQDFVKQSIAPYKYPRSIVFIDQLPRTETGKLQRFKLRNLA